MQPDSITLIRHGQSTGNEDRKLYATTPDYALHLTALGHSQAKKAGAEIARALGEPDRVHFYVSPWIRARETFFGVAESFEKFGYYEDPRIREQEWGHLRSDDSFEEVDLERDVFGHFHYRLKDGESCADTYDRVSDFMNTMHRDFQKESFPKHVIVVTHGITFRVFLMRWFHLSVEQFELMSNPHNCEHLTLNLDPKTKKYTPNRPLRIYKQPKSKYQFTPTQDQQDLFTRGTGQRFGVFPFPTVINTDADHD